MKSPRSCAYGFLWGSALLSLLSILIEGASSYSAEMIAVSLASASLLCVIATAICAGIYIGHPSTQNPGLFTFWVAAFPFVVIGIPFLFSVRGNVHGGAIAAFFLYALISEALALGLTIYLIVHRL